VIKDGGKSEIWEAMLQQYDSDEPIVVASDPLNEVHVYLWKVGIKDTTALIERCWGRLLTSFDIKEAAVRSIGRDLASYFHEAEKRSNWTYIGHLISIEDTTPDPERDRYKGVLTGQIPKFEHLRKGYFKERCKKFALLWESFQQWLLDFRSSNHENATKIPVFWITGRSGTGKSVFLLQLLAKLLRSKSSPALLFASRENLPRILETIPDRESTRHELHKKRVFSGQSIYIPGFTGTCCIPGKKFFTLI